MYIYSYTVYMIFIYKYIDTQRFFVWIYVYVCVYICIFTAWEQDVLLCFENAKVYGKGRYANVVQAAERITKVEQMHDNDICIHIYVYICIHVYIYIYT
jgi:hypothetical protein